MKYLILHISTGGQLCSIASQFDFYDIALRDFMELKSAPHLGHYKIVKVLRDEQPIKRIKTQDNTK